MPKLNVSEARKAWGDLKKAQPKYAEVIGGKYQFGKLLDKYGSASDAMVPLAAQYLAAHKDLQVTMPLLLQAMAHMLEDVKKNTSFSREEAKKLESLLMPIYELTQHNYEQLVKDSAELRKLVPVL